jgi:tRNA 2-thiouridine synthesizing protein A
MIIKNVKIDLLGLKCPLPVLKANKLIKEHKKGDIIELLVDDIAAPNDFRIYCETKNYKLLSIKKSKHITIKIEI